MDPAVSTDDKIQMRHDMQDLKFHMSTLVSSIQYENQTQDDQAKVDPGCSHSTSEPYAGGSNPK